MSQFLLNTVLKARVAFGLTVLLTLFLGCKLQKDHLERDIDNLDQPFSPLNFAIFALGSEPCLVFDTSYGTTQLDVEDFSIIDSIILESLLFHQIDISSVSFDKDYRKQCVPAVAPNGDKEAWVNCLLGTRKNWRRQVVFDRGCGDCFGVAINLTRRTWSKFTLDPVM